MGHTLLNDLMNAEAVHNGIEYGSLRIRETSEATPESGKLSHYV